ncbi:hypothetical protein NIES2100_08080 [Calothrix sp. NIES-2100]|uniref:ELWxxDGT repeat protein n=1 Tax=Calothrix sp. NIES-2100 TaxID=1954172 RepID=UPI000B5E9180|nr:hypothetical protein NIES2100_08080 [Calothrix sp. NIES-2100]
MTTVDFARFMPVVPVSIQQTMDSGIVFIDSRVAQYEQLAAAVTPGLEVVVLDPQDDGVAEISKKLSQHQGITSLHLVAHGQPGQITLGRSPLSLFTLDLYNSALQQWKTSLAPGANILLYGCEVGAGHIGIRFINSLSQLLGTPVAASSSKVGNAVVGGNWDLDVTTGKITTAQAFSPEATTAYPHVLSEETSISLLKDINTSGASSNPQYLTNVNGTLYFVAYDSNGGTELWKSDGTEAGTVRVKDIFAGIESSNPQSLTNVNGTLYFVAYDSSGGAELWKSDGTEAGTVRVRDIFAGSGSSNPYNLTNVNGTLYFVATDGNGDSELWKSDGTSAGTVIVKDIFAGTSSSNPQNLTNINGTLYFSATDSTGGTELWKSDGTSAGTVRVKDIFAGTGSSNPQNLTDVNGTLYFVATDSNGDTELWKSDGTSAGTVIVKDIFAGTGSSNPQNLTNVNGTLYFSATDSTGGTELWKSDGTSAGTIRVKDIVSSTGSSNPQNLTNVNGILYFSATDSSGGRELWKSDGTESGTVRVKDIFVGTGSSNPQNLTNINGTLYFVATDSTGGTELWKSDGTSAGTVRVQDIVPGTGSSNPQSLTNVDGTLYFSAANSSDGRELWKTDVSSAETVRVKDIFAGTGSSKPQNLTNINGTLYFSAADSSSGRELWKSDGTEAGTVRVRDILSGTGSSNPQNLTNVNGIVYFSATNSSGGYELWKSDGTSAGTVRVKDIFAGSTSSNPQNLTNVNGTLYFTAIDSSGGYELWKSNGTDAGTVRVKDIVSGSGSSTPQNLTNVNGTLYFTAIDSSGGRELWKSDGTQAGTVRVKDIFSGTSSSIPQDLTNVNGTLYFVATDSTGGAELWKSDGTDAGTVIVKDIFTGSESSNAYDLTNVNGTLYFVATDSTGGTELWKSDGTDAGTVRVKDIFTGSESSSPSNLTNVNGTLYFVATDSSGGTELWKSDGTDAGTVRVRDIFVGTESSNPSNLTNVNGTLYFVATDSTGGTELWKSDGTAAGTVRVNDLFPGSAASNPSDLTYINGKLYFVADNGNVGQELFVLKLNSAPTDVSLSNSSVNENAIANTVIGNLNTTDPDLGNTHTYTLVAGAGSADNSSFSIVGNQLQINLSPDYETKNSYSIRIRTTDQDGLFYEKAIAIAINNLNEAPTGTASASLIAGTEDTDYTITAAQLLQGFTDVDGDTLSVSGLTANNGSISSNVNGTTYTFTPDANFNGTVSLSYNVVDGNGGAVAATQSLNITAVNDAPTGTASASLTAGTEDTDYTITAAQLLQGFTDVDGDTLSVSGLTANNGSISSNVNGTTYTFTPDANFNGTVSLSYNVVDGNGGAVAATQSLNITAVNDAPTGTASASLIAGMEDTDYTINATQLLQGFTDVDGDTLSVSGLSANNGSISSNDNGTTYTFTPDANFNGTVSLSYNVVDGNGGAVAATQSFNITGVNDVPTGVASASLSLGVEDTVYTINAADLLLGFTDVDADSLSVSDLTANNGALVDNGNGIYTFIPDANFNGTVSLSYNVIDGNGGAIAATQSLNITGVNDAPSGTASASLTAGTEDTNYNITSAQLLQGFTDVDGDTLSVADLTATNGALLDHLDGTYTFTPDANFNGTVSLSYNVIDGNGGAVAATQSFNITAVNDAPTGTASASLIAGMEDTDYTINATQLLQGFTDVDGDTLSVSGLSANNGSISSNDNGTTYTFTPDANFNGTVSLSYNVVDGNGGAVAATQSFNITAVNDAPSGVASASLVPGNEDTVYTINAADLLLGFTDVDADSLSVADLTATNGILVDNLDGTYTFTPNANFNGTVSLSYNIIDGNGGAVAATQSFNITGVNDVPTGVASASLSLGVEDTVYTINAADLLLGFTDVDADSLSVSDLTANNGALVDNSDRTYTFTPDANFNGTVSLSYNVIDGNGGAVAATQSFNITAVNDAPTGVASVSLVPGNEDTVYTINAADLLLGFTDVDADSLSVSDLTATNGILVDNLDGTYTFTPDANFNGTVSLSYNVVDGNGGAVAATQSFNITGVNDAPTGTASASLTAGTEDTDYIITATQLLQGFTDVDADTLSVADLIATNGALVDNLDGTYTFTPDANFNGTVSLSYNVVDGNGGAVAATQSFNITAVNDAPVATNDTFTTIQETAITVSAATLLSNDSDVDVTDILDIIAITQPSQGTLVKNNNGTYTYTPVTGYYGSDSFTYTISDGLGLTSTATVNLTINPNFNVINGTSIADNLTGTAQRDMISGFQGNDTLLGLDNNDTLKGDDGNDSLDGGTGNDLLYGGNDNDNLIGNSGNDTLFGDAGDDSLDGGLGNDILDGGVGHDTYIVDNSSDIITEGLDAGTDLVQSSVTWTLGTNLENLTLTGSTAINGVGNNLNNIITGNTGANSLSGGNGDDTLVGASGNDTLFGEAGNDSLVGSSGNDTLFGGEGDDRLDGGTGNDSLDGGLGHDTYTVDSVNDRITEGLNAGTDLVNSSVNWTLGDNLENLTLTSGGLNGTGNNLDNVITGNSVANSLTGGLGNDTLIGGSGDDSLFGNEGNDLLDGGSGSDILDGGIGDDTYIVNISSDTITEALNAGTDLVNSSATLTLGANLENLTLTGTSNISGTGNSLDNILTGNSGANSLRGQDGNDTVFGGDGNDTLFGSAGNDVLVGGFGQDQLSGGSGNDRFVFDSLGEGIDTITDFIRTDDVLVLKTLLTNLNYTGTNPIADGYVRAIQSGTNTLIDIDTDGLGVNASFSNLVILNNFTASNFSQSNLIF